jgi:amino acid transporter
MQRADIVVERSNYFIRNSMSFLSTQSSRAPSPVSLPSSTHSSPWIRKPLSVVHQQESSLSLHALGEQQRRNNDNNTDTTTPSANAAVNQLRRHLSVYDLIGIGVGGTVGSGIFVLTGQIAAQYSGKAVALSFAIAGTAAVLSGACYAELSARIPAAGSTYVYAYVCLGELAAVLAAACLTLEYGVSGAAVARTWGDKVLLWLQHHTSSSLDWLQPGGGMVNLPAFAVSAVSTTLLLSGVQESKRVMNAVTALKMLIVLFMIVGGFMLYNRELTASQPFAPFGASGVLRGATTSFFGYLGYDEVCCVAGEAKHPARDMPRAVLGTLLTVTVCYVLAATALTGMLPYTEISPTAGFPDAFAVRHWEWAAELTAAGEVLTLPVVVLISLMAQPRLTLSMSVDGLLPSIFSSVDSSGNLRGGTLVSGVVMTVIATFVPFTYLDDLISAGILVAFSMTNSCLVLLRCESPVEHPGLLEQLLAVYNALCFLTAMLWSHTWTLLPFQTLAAVCSTLGTIACLYSLAVTCPKTLHFGGSILREGEYTSEHHVTHEPGENEERSEETAEVEYFCTPAVPYLPCLGMAVNWYLIAQLDVTGIFLLCVYLGVTAGIYYLGCAPNSVGHIRNWNVRGNYETVQNTAVRAAAGDTDDDDVYTDGESELSQIPGGLTAARKSKLTRTNSL